MNPQISQIDANSRDPQTYAIIGAAMEMPRQLGSGFQAPTGVDDRLVGWVLDPRVHYSGVPDRQG
jgi:hypothetical protein